MIYEEIVGTILQLLCRHIKDTAYIGQEPYKGDFFRAFKEAYKQGYCHDRPRELLTADALIDVIVARWKSESAEEEKRKQIVLEQLNAMWREWIYAWDHYDPGR